MKKIAFIAAAFLLTLSVTSCGKSYTCHCVYSENGEVDHETDNQINEGKKSKSASKCAEGSNTTSSTLNGVTYTTTTTCALK